MIKGYLLKYKEEFKKCFSDLRHKDTFYKQIPNLLTFMRLIFAIPAGVLYYVNPILSASLIALLWATDAIDGKIARKFNLQSKLGADMDTIADKLMFLGSSIPLLGNIPFLAFNFLLEGVISGINVYGRLKGVNTKTVVSGKIKTILMALTLVFGYLTQLLPLPRIILTALIGATSVMQTIAINDYVEEYDRMKKEANNKVDDVSSLEDNNSDNNSLEINNDLKKELENLKKLYLDSTLSDKKYTGKVRTRKLVQEKKNN